MTGWGGWPVVGEDASFDRAQALLREAELGDGLPLVPPTERRLRVMQAGIADPTASRGALPPLFGELAPDAVAYQCVIAGAPTGALPVVMAAAEAMLDPSFNLLGIATTTGTAAVALCIHGPIAAHLGVSAGTNCLGPNEGANAGIGRALQLVLRNIGGARPGVGDMATMGQPAKFSLCFAEQSDSPFPPLPVRRNLPRDSVTVLGISGTQEILPADGEGDTPEAILTPVARAMSLALDSGGGRRRNEAGEQVLLLPPELAHKVAARGWDLAAVQRYLFEAVGRIARAPEAIHPIVTGGAGIKMTYLPLWGGGTATVTRGV